MRSEHLSINAVSAEHFSIGFKLHTEEVFHAGRKQEKSNQEVKSSAFTTYFSNSENAAKLYSALDGTENVSPEDIAITTLNGVLFMARKNDRAFTVKKVLVISEHQSDVNMNMPLRDAIYYGRILEKLIDPWAICRTGLIPIPIPEFFVFYNGDKDFPQEKIMKLSDAYLEKTEHPMLELSVKVININFLSNHPILEKCRPLYKYSWFIRQIKEYLQRGDSQDEAIIRAMQDCEEKGYLTEFLSEHGTEAVSMLFKEFGL